VCLSVYVRNLCWYEHTPGHIQSDLYWFIPRRMSYNIYCMGPVKAMISVKYMCINIFNASFLGSFRVFIVPFFYWLNHSVHVTFLSFQLSHICIVWFNSIHLFQFFHFILHSVMWTNSMQFHSFLALHFFHVISRHFMQFCRISVMFIFLQFLCSVQFIHTFKVIQFAHVVVFCSLRSHPSIFFTSIPKLRINSFISSHSFRFFRFIDVFQLI